MESTMNIRASLVFMSAFLLLVFRETSAQYYPDERPGGVSGETFYLDQPGNCKSSSSYSVTGKTIIVGRSLNTGSTIPKDCTITLETYGLKPMKFELQIAELKLDYDMNFYIYDGRTTDTLLKSYDVHRGNDNAFHPIYTTGSIVSFRLVRIKINSNANYHIRIIAHTVEAPVFNGDGSNHHLDRAQHRDRKFDTDIIIILMSTAYIFAFLIYGIVLLVYWKRRTAGKEKWTERPLGYDNPGLATQTLSTLDYVEQVKTNPPDNPRVQSPADFNKMNGRQPHNYQTRMAQSSVDADSVFEEKIKRRNESSNGPLQRETYSNQAYQHTPVRSRVRLSQRNARSSNNRNKDSNSPTYSDVPSVHQENKTWQPKPRKQVKPEPNLSESEEEVERASIGMNTDPEMTDHGVQCDASSEPEGPPSKPSTTVTSVGVGSSPVLSSRRNSPGPRRYHRPPSYEEALSDVDFPSLSPNEPRSSPKPKQPSRVPYVHYSNPTLRRPQPVYSQNPQQHPDISHPTHLPKMGNENNIPIYSYLVNRGYNIDDGQSSGDATSHRSDSRLGHTDDSDVTANLDCGIELMRR